MHHYEYLGTFIDKVCEGLTKLRLVLCPSIYLSFFLSLSTSPCLLRYCLSRSIGFDTQTYTHRRTELHTHTHTHRERERERGREREGGREGEKTNH